LIDPQYIRVFEDAHAVTVVIRYYGSNEELIAKMRSTNGAAADLVVPSDYAVARLIAEKLLLPLDHEALQSLNHSDPAFLDRSFDPENRYSVPYMWDAVGIGYVEGALTQADRLRGWGAVFAPRESTVVMVNDPVEAIALAAAYRDLLDEPFTPDVRDEITEALKAQRPFVEAYSNFRSDYALATRSVPLAVMTTTYAERAARTFPHVRFFVPPEGRFMNIENFSVSVATKNRQVVYDLINFLTTHESLIYHSDLYTMRSVLSAPADIDEYRFFNDQLSDQEKFDLWISVKS
jgi:spermidine/putrescine transport system substrate-binding protein